MSRNETIRIDTPRGVPIAGTLVLPDGEPVATLCLAHCFACGKDFPASMRLCRQLAERGFACLRFDFMGLGDAEGDFVHATWDSYREDFTAAVAALETRIGRSCDFYAGHSFGGTVALAAALDRSDLAGVVTIASPAEPKHVVHLFADGRSALDEFGVARIDLAGKTLDIGREFVDSVDAYHLQPRLSALQAPLLVLHAPNDPIVGVHNARAIFDHAPHPKSFVALHTADHLLSRPAHTAQIAALIDAWSMPMTAMRARPGGANERYQ